MTDINKCKQAHIKVQTRKSTLSYYAATMTMEYTAFGQHISVTNNQGTSLFQHKPQCLFVTTHRAFLSRPFCTFARQITQYKTPLKRTPISGPMSLPWCPLKNHNRNLKFPRRGILYPGKSATVSFALSRTKPHFVHFVIL